MKPQMTDEALAEELAWAIEIANKMLSNCALTEESVCRAAVEAARKNMMALLRMGYNYNPTADARARLERKVEDEINASLQERRDALKRKSIADLDELKRKNEENKKFLKEARETIARIRGDLIVREWDEGLSWELQRVLEERQLTAAAFEPDAINVDFLLDLVYEALRVLEDPHREVPA